MLPRRATGVRLLPRVGQVIKVNVLPVPIDSGRDKTEAVELGLGCAVTLGENQSYRAVAEIKTRSNIRRFVAASVVVAVPSWITVAVLRHAVDSPMFSGTSDSRK